MDKTTNARLVTREDRAWEQIVFAEVLIPDVVNNYGDIYTKDAIVRFCHEFARQGYGIDIEHDNVNVDKEKAYVVESFIARAGDPDFIEGAWVIGMKVPDLDTWNDILEGRLNGFSFEAIVTAVGVTFDGFENVQIEGTTEPNPVDGHTHSYVLILDLFGNPLAGGTSETNGHSHKIVSHTVTEVESGHNHRFQVYVSETE